MTEFLAPRAGGTRGQHLVPKTQRKPQRGRKKSTPQQQERTTPARTARPDWWIYCILFFATLAVFAPVRHFDFTNFDDPDYVANPHVRAGITPESVEWAFTGHDAANWFPLTRLSHLLDHEFFGEQSGFDHLVNVLLHALAALLLFAFLSHATGADARRQSAKQFIKSSGGAPDTAPFLHESLDPATGARWPSAFVAFLFALHPLHVESVAWIAERKDVLSAFFWFLALWAYVRYVQRPTRGQYLLALFAFCLGLLAKPMLVTLPFVLLLLDIWPLRRLPVTSSVAWKKAVREKIPFFVASLAVALVTYLVQQGAGAVRGVPFGIRIENALVSYILYIVKTFWPTRLAVFYPYPAEIPLWQVLASALVILANSAAVLRAFGRYPYLAVGWFWYLGTLLPVIGLVQVGAQARADRYMYIPMVGLLIMLAWGAADALERWPRAKPALAAFALAACASSLILTSFQLQYWRNSETLFRHALDVTSGNYLAHHNLGVALADEGRFDEAIKQYQAALQIEPNAANVETDYGNALARSGHIPEAIAHYQEALRALPDSPIAHNDLANAFAANPGSMRQAIAEYQTALRLKPDYEEARNNLAKVQSNAAETQYNLGVDLAKSGKPEAAIPHFEEALRLKPDYVDAHNNLGVVLAGTGRVQEAISHFEAALRIDPDSAEAHVNLGIALSGIPGRTPEAIRHFKAALRIKPDPEIQQMQDRLEKSR